MKSPAVHAIAALPMGAAVGSAVSVPWLAALAHQQADQPGAALTAAAAPIVATPLLLVLSLALALRIHHRISQESLAALIAWPAAALAYAVAHALYTLPVPTTPCLRLLIPGLAVLTFAFVRRHGYTVPFGVALCLGAVPYAHDIPALTGAQLAAAAYQYSPPPAPAYWLNLLVPVVMIGVIGGLIRGWLLGVRPARAARTGLTTGLALTCMAIASHLTAFATTMGTAASRVAVYGGFVLLWSAILVVRALALQYWADPRSSWLPRLSPFFLALVLAAYLTTAFYGTRDYLALARYHPDTAYTYLHFSETGSWRRTINSDGNVLKLSKCRHFLAAYPRSAYRPAALFTLAEVQYELWDFSAARRTLDSLLSRYPCFQDSAEVLRALAAVSAGDSPALLEGVPTMPRFASWRGSQGALLAASAAEASSQPHRALGFYAAYIEHLRTRRPASWTAQSIAYADARSDHIMAALKERVPVRRTATVTTRIMADGTPVEGARVVLVQPHPDAALPADSQQFTGAWTIPVWGGVWGVSDYRGVVEIKNVPYGKHQVVLGLPLKVARSGCVVSSAVPAVQVASHDIALPPIRLVRGVRLLTPANHATVGTDVRLSWEPYPGAHHYSVSVIALDLPANASRSARLALGQTCWSKSGISGPSTRITAGSPLSAGATLLPGGTYMWIVYAYDRRGHLLASSEHYADLFEPCFTIRPKHLLTHPRISPKSTIPGGAQTRKGGTN